MLFFYANFYFWFFCVQIFRSVFFVHFFPKLFHRFQGILQKLETEIGGGRDAANYINGIDPTSYAQHAFPLPCVGKVTSNPMEQENSGLLAITEFAPLKLLVDL